MRRLTRCWTYIRSESSKGDGNIFRKLLHQIIRATFVNNILAATGNVRVPYREAYQSLGTRADESE